MRKPWIAALAAALLSSSAAAATKSSVTIVPSGSASGSVSPKSKVQVSGTGQAKVSVKGVTDGLGALVTTDGTLGTSDDYLMWIRLTGFSGTDTAFVKLDLAEGKGSATVDISGVTVSSILPRFAISRLTPPPADPGLCPGANSPDELAARSSNFYCEANEIGFGGVTPGESSTKMKVSIGPLEQDCYTNIQCISDVCSGTSTDCSTNSDCNRCSLTTTYCVDDAACNAGAPSAKSKFQMNGAGQVKVTLSGALDATGQPLTNDGTIGTADDSIVFVELSDSDLVPLVYLSLKADFEEGKAKVSADLSALFAPGTATYARVVVVGPPDVPGDCPGTNTPEDIAARSGNGDCFTGEPKGAGDFVPGE